MKQLQDTANQNAMNQQLNIVSMCLAQQYAKLYYDVKNNQDTHELTEYNRRDMTIVFPDKGPSPSNPSGYLCRTYGCQMIAMRYQLVDNFLMENALFFDRAGYAFCLKPADLRYQPVTIPTPTPQNPAYSYSTRNATTDYYEFNF